MRTPRSAAAVLGGLVLACAAAFPVAAQTFPTLRIGQSAQGTLGENDPSRFGGGRFKVYQFRAEPGRRYVLTMQSADFDSYIVLARTVGGITDEMMNDDDGGSEPLSSRLRFEVPEAGTYLLIAQALSEEGVGAYTVALDTQTIRPLQVGAITVGQTVQSEITDDDAEFDDTEGYYDVYRFQGRAGQRLRVKMEFGEYIPSVAIGTMQEGRFVPIDEMGGMSGSQTITLPEAGEYYVQAGAYGSVSGPYTLTLEERAPAPAPTTQPLRRGEAVQGSIESGDAELDDGRWYDAYAYTGRAGETLVVRMSAEDFDTYLIIGRMVDGEFQELDRNDDAADGEGTNSRLEIELPEDGRYVIQATSFLPESEGAYELSVGEP
jgi:hypothetical protein